jgi:hypothetical protein
MSFLHAKVMVVVVGVVVVVVIVVINILHEVDWLWSKDVAL